MLKTRSVYSPIDRKSDGLRILVTRFRGRGLRKTRYHVWMANLGPSEKLLKAIHSGTISWPEFTRLYREELLMDGAADKNNKTIKNHAQKFTLRLIKHLSHTRNVTLLCHCDEDAERCHRHILRKMILSKGV